jgi:hypothetical protein
MQSVPPAAASGSGAPSASGAEPPDFRNALYEQPEPQECDVDADCPGGCCIQIGVSLRQCQGDSSCTLHWITPPPKTIRQWLPSDFAGYTGSFAADVVHSRIEESLDSDGHTIFKLENQQYWFNYSATGPIPAAGDECWIVPGRLLYHLYVSQRDQPLGVSQIPVVSDTSLVGATANLAAHGVYELQGAGYWRVFSESRSTGRRVLLASPNNLNYWIFTEGRSDNPVDPVLVRADSNVTRSEVDGFVLANGQAWAYYASGPLQSEAPAVGDHAIVYQQALVSDDDPDLPILDTTWVEGKSTGGLILVVPAR